MSQWREWFEGYYPEKDPHAAGPAAGLSGALAQLDLRDYRIAVYEMRLDRVLIWLEERRVQRAFQDLEGSAQRLRDAA